jgi:hypothetical protein
VERKEQTMRGAMLGRGARALAVAVVVATCLGAGVNSAVARPLPTWTWYCGSYQSWTDSYSGDVVHWRACIAVSSTGYVVAGGRSYVTNYNSNKPINPWHVVVHLYDNTGASKDTNSCDRTSAPVGSSNVFGCNTSSYNITASGSKATSDVCLFYTSGQTNCSGWASYTKS